MCSPEPRPRLLALEGGHCAAKWKMTEHGFGAASLGRSWRSRPRGTEMDVVGPGTLWEGAESAGGREGGRRPLTAGGRAGTVRPASRSRARGPHLPLPSASHGSRGADTSPTIPGGCSGNQLPRAQTRWPRLPEPEGAWLLRHPRACPMVACQDSLRPLSPHAAALAPPPPAAKSRLLASPSAERLNLCSRPAAGSSV